VILTVTLNAAIDKTLSVPSFRVGRRHRTVAQQAMAGGKGINVARALKCLGRPVIATGLAGGATGTRIVEELTAESILNDFVRIGEESRTNTSVLDPTTGEQTEINERGPRVSEAEIETFRDKLLYLARGAAIVVFAGSLPRGVEPSIYAELVRELAKLGLTTVVDADGEPLRQAVKAAPNVLSPNVSEAEELVGHEWADEEELAEGAREIVKMGAREAIITRPDGCIASLLVDGSPTLLRAQIAEREPVAPAGSGDAFVAGYVAARYEGARAEDCLRLAVAAGADSTARMGAGVLELREVERLAAEVEVKTLQDASARDPVGGSDTMRGWK
jgi:1-phosphofructokinase family hexose kinase